MPRERKVFLASVAAQLPEPYPFSLQFVVIDDLGVPSLDDNGNVQVVEHDFTAAATPGAGAVITASEVVRWDPESGQQGLDLSSIKTFFSRVLTADDMGRLSALLDDRHMTIELEQIAEVYRWLVQEYSGRPTEPSSVSSTGRRITGPRSTEPASLTASTS